ncbi:MAG: hypothetical protein HYU59_07230 [Magnetospirillum gryphiswaldense]|nr:hypothetical protein [Magnetospirillum gryphiswaldense]
MTEHIQINDVAPRVQYLADGVQSAFTFPFAIFTGTDLEVWLDDALQSAGYGVSGAGISTGGTALFATPPAAGTRVTLRRRLPIRRTTDYQADGLIRAKTLNDEMDYQVAALQQVADEMGRAVKRAVTSPALADLTLPEPAASRGLKWNALGTALVNTDHDPDAVGNAALAAAQAQEAATIATTVAAQLQSANGGIRIDDDDDTLAPLAAKLTAGAGITLSVAQDTDGRRMVVASDTPAGLEERLAWLERNLAVNTLRDQIDSGWSVLKMVDGIADEFEDTSGVDVNGPAPLSSHKLIINSVNEANGSTTITDIATGKAVTKYGGIAHSTAKSLFGTSAIRFDGVDDYLSLADSNDWYFNTSDFTLEVWFNPDGETSGPLLNQIAGGAWSGYVLQTYYNVDGTISVYIDITGGAAWQVASVSPATALAGQWNHLAITRENGLLRCFLNGELWHSKTLTTYPDTAQPFTIGRTSNGTSYFKGYVAEVAVEKGRARYTSSFTPLRKAYNQAGSDASSNYDYDEAMDCFLSNPDYSTTSSFSTFTGNNINPGHTILDRNISLPNGYELAKVMIGHNGGSNTTGCKIKVFKENSSTSFDVVHEQSFDILFPAEGGYMVTLTPPFIIPATGTYRIGAYTGSAGLSHWNSVSRAYKTGDITGTGTTGFSADSGACVNLTPYMRKGGDMTLKSLPVAVSTSPTEIRLLTLLEPMVSVTSADYSLEASIDNGTTWVTGTLTDAGAFDQTTRIVSAVFDTSGGAGTNACWRFKTYNTKPQRLHGVWMQWR